MELTNDFRVAVPVAEAWAVLTDVERIAPCLPGAQLQEVDGDEYRGVVKVKVGPITAQYKGTATFVERDDTAHRAVLRAEGRDARGQGNASAMVTATLTPDGDHATKVTVATDLTITGKVAQFGRGVLAEVSGKLIGQFVDNLERDVLSTSPGGAASPSPARATLRPGSQATTVPPAVPPGAPNADAAAPPQTAAAPPAAQTTAAPPSAPATPVVTGANSAPPPAHTASASGNSAGTVRRIDSPEAAPVDLLATAGSSVAKRALPMVAALLVALFVWRRRGRRARR